MAKAIALVQRNAHLDPAELARATVVAFCALALITAGQFLPF